MYAFNRCSEEGRPSPICAHASARDGARRIAMVTAYDFTMARLVDEAGVDMVLVGDSLGMVVQGLANTLPVTLDEIAYHCRAVARGLTRAHVVGDMPFMSYQVSPTQAVESAGKLMKEGGVREREARGRRGVRRARAPHRARGHAGDGPRRAHAAERARARRLQGAGRGDEAAEQGRSPTRSALEEAGAYAIVLEAIPPDLAARVTAAVGIPTIGIGAGAGCDGQVLVCTDLLGLARGHRRSSPSASPSSATRRPGAARTWRGAQRRVPRRRAHVQAERSDAAGESLENGEGLRRELGVELGDLDTPLPLDHWH